MKDAKCEGCVYWRALELKGQCRRHAPKTIVSGCGTGEVPEYSNDWAETARRDWCGDWREALG